MYNYDSFLSSCRNLAESALDISKSLTSRVVSDFCSASLEVSNTIVDAASKSFQDSSKLLEGNIGNEYCKDLSQNFSACVQNCSNAQKDLNSKLFKGMADLSCGAKTRQKAGS